MGERRGRVRRRAIALGLLAALAAVTCKKGATTTATATPPAGATPAVTTKSGDSGKPFPLAEQRARFETKVFAESYRSRPPEPPPGVLELVSYPAPLGENAAYVSPKKDGAPRPAIVWIVGGFNWGLGTTPWAPAPHDNDQSARAFGEAGIVAMFPSLRGANKNPGKNECFLGEVDDVIAAAAYLARRPDVDPKRIYLGGHSTGGTMALLVAESSARFRAVFAFGPVADARDYGERGCLPTDVSDEEGALRAPIRFLNDIRTPTLVIEGAEGNAQSVKQLERQLAGGTVTFQIVPGATHFSVLAPATEALAKQILDDIGPAPHFELDVVAIGKAVAH